MEAYRLKLWIYAKQNDRKGFNGTIEEIVRRFRIEPQYIADLRTQFEEMFSEVRQQQAEYEAVKKTVDQTISAIESFDTEMIQKLYPDISKNDFWLIEMISRWKSVKIDYQVLNFQLNNVITSSLQSNDGTTIVSGPKGDATASLFTRMRWMADPPFKGNKYRPNFISLVKINGKWKIDSF